ncbi:MAG: hypothetical protein ACYDEY_12400 [Acidimicrobiales bacterium]
MKSSEQAGLSRFFTLRAAAVATVALALIVGASVFGLWVTAGSGAATTRPVIRITMTNVCSTYNQDTALQQAICRKAKAGLQHLTNRAVRGEIPGLAKFAPQNTRLTPGQPLPAMANGFSVYTPGEHGNDIHRTVLFLEAKYRIADLTSQGGGSTHTWNLGFYTGSTQENGQGHGILFVSWGSRYDWNKFGPTGGHSHRYVTAQAGGALTPMSVVGGIITLKAVDGAIYTFNVKTATFARASG